MIEFINTFKISDILGVHDGEHFDICIIGRLKGFDTLIKNAFVNNEGHIVYPTLANGFVTLESEMVCDLINRKYDVRVNGKCRGE